VSGQLNSPSLSLSPIPSTELVLSEAEGLRTGKGESYPIGLVVLSPRAMAYESSAVDQSDAGMGWYYLVPVGKGVQLRLPEGEIKSFGSLVVEPGQALRERVGAFKKAGWLNCWAVGAWDKNCREPWLLVTNDPNSRSRGYALRMWEEAAFRDFKSNGWQWQRSHLYNPQHASRLWLVMALAYLWMISLGTRVLHRPPLLRSLTRGKTVRLSVFNLGIRYFYHCLVKNLTPPLTLALIPCQKSVV